jgi:hypothetical protein
MPLVVVTSMTRFLSVAQRDEGELGAAVVGDGRAPVELGRGVGVGHEAVSFLRWDCIPQADQVAVEKRLGDLGGAGLVDAKLVDHDLAIETRRRAWIRLDGTARANARCELVGSCAWRLGPLICSNRKWITFFGSRIRQDCMFICTPEASRPGAACRTP